MFERLNRRLDALRKQIEAEKLVKQQPHEGLTHITDTERWHAKHNERRPLDFADTEPGVGVAPCAADRGEPEPNTTSPWLVDHP